MSINIVNRGLRLKIHLLKIIGSLGQMAVIEADKLLDQAMIELGISGKLWAKGLSKQVTIFLIKNAIWVAHNFVTR